MAELSKSGRSLKDGAIFNFFFYEVIATSRCIPWFSTTFKQDIEGMPARSVPIQRAVEAVQGFKPVRSIIVLVEGFAKQT